jgi:hypothetical protein
MKNQIKTIAIALLLGITFYSNADTLPAKPSIKTYAISMYKVNGESLYNLFINKIVGSNLKIMLKDANNETVYEKFIRKNETKFRTKLNLTEMEKGHYILEISDGKNMEKRSIEITGNSKIENNAITFEAGIIQLVASPILKVNINKVEGAKVHIYLKNEDGSVIIDDVMKKSQLIYRTKFNLSKLEKGTYQLEITDGAQKEVKSVEIQ